MQPRYTSEPNSLRPRHPSVSRIHLCKSIARRRESTIRPTGASVFSQLGATTTRVPTFGPTESVGMAPAVMMSSRSRKYDCGESLDSERGKLIDSNVGASGVTQLSTSLASGRVKKPLSGRHTASRGGSFTMKMKRMAFIVIARLSRNSAPPFAVSSREGKEMPVAIATPPR